ncbi:hypothetical protein HNR34_003702 [Geobacillus subterraneus]
MLFYLIIIIIFLCQVHFVVEIPILEKQLAFIPPLKGR